MRLRPLLLCAAILAAWPVRAREKTDVVVMRNGDRLTCEIKSLSADSLYISLDYALGTVSIDWFKVDHLESKQLFLVKTEDGHVYSGTLSIPKTEGGRPVWIKVAETDGYEVELQRDQVTRLDQSAARFWQRFNGSVGLGAIYNKGNQSTEYSLSSEIEYPQERWAASASYNSTLSSSSAASTSTRNQIDASAFHLMPWNNWYYIGIVGFLRSSEQGIDLQSTFGGGVGRYLKNSNRFSFAVSGGLAFQRITYQEQLIVAPVQDLASGWVSADAKVFRFDRTNLTLTARLLPAFSDPGRVHFNMNSSYYIKMWSKFNFNFTFYGSWDTRPPPGFSGSDYGTSAGVNWTFGNR